jgi:hypothetical protein
MATTDVDVSFMNSYFNKNISKDEMFARFPVDKEVSIEGEMHIIDYKDFVINLGKLTWVIHKYFMSVNNDNKITILEIIEMYMVHYYNYNFNKIKHNVENNDKKYENMSEVIDSIGYLIVRLHYKIKYFELRTLPYSELYAYITMEENLTINSNIKKEHNKKMELLAPPSTGDLNDIFQLTRLKIHEMIHMIRSGASNEICSLLLHILEYVDPNKKLELKIDETLIPEPTIPNPVVAFKNETISINNYINTKNENLSNNIIDIAHMSKEVDIDDIDMDDMDDIGLEIISDETVAELIKENINSTNVINDLDDMLESRSRSSSIDDSVEYLMDEDVLESEPKTLNADEITKKYFSNAWEINKDIKITHICKYIALNSINESDVELKKIIKYETRYIMYILSFLKTEIYI